MATSKRQRHFTPFLGKIKSYGSFFGTVGGQTLSGFSCLPIHYELDFLRFLIDNNVSPSWQ
ncbi:MAG: hypothetical protein FWH27_05550 [Planctomycetaceae bacterium]|nr:hypothetical protein [Planctomycetaceae bacterium]